MNRKQVVRELVKIAKGIISIDVVDVRELVGRYKEFQEEAEKAVVLTVEDLEQTIRQINYEGRDLADIIYQRENLRPTEHRFTDEDKEIAKKEQKKRAEVKSGIKALIKELEKSKSVFR